MPDEPASTSAPDVLTADAFCATCGYSLRTLSPAARCPECGTPVSASAPTAEVEPVIDGISPASPGTVCCNCQAAIEGRHRHQFCRSCGTPLWATIPTVWLRWCDPLWLQRVRSAITWWLWTLLISFVLAFGGGVVGVIWGARGSPISARGSMISIGLTNVVMLILHLVVVYRLSTPHPGSRIQDTPTLRGITRGFALYALLAAAAMQGVLLGGGSAPTITALSVLSTPALLSTIGAFLYVRGLACRIPNRKLIERLTLLMWTYGSLMVAMQALGLISLQALDLDGGIAPAPSLGPQMLVGCASGVVGLVLLLCQGALAVLLFTLRRVVLQATQSARAESESRP